MTAPRHTRDIGRLNAFTDGVMVVSMTLLILDVRLPDDAAKLTGAHLVDMLRALVPNYLGYVLSFLVIARYWMGYTVKFEDLRDADDGFAWLNIVFLMAIGFVPFATTLISRSDDWRATIVYAATMVAASSMLALMWLYARHRDLIREDVSLREDWREILPWLQVVLVFALSATVAPFEPANARYIWLLLLIPIPIKRVG